jgi:hypothetical protein
MFANAERAAEHASRVLDFLASWPLSRTLERVEDEDRRVVTHIHEPVLTSPDLAAQRLHRVAASPGSSAQELDPFEWHPDDCTPEQLERIANGESARVVLGGG